MEDKVTTLARNTESTGLASQGSVAYGYARVSTADQNLSRQLYALEKAGVANERVFADKASGRDFNRPAWVRLMQQLKRGDTLVVKSIDRLGRNYDEMVENQPSSTKDSVPTVRTL